MTRRPNVFAGPYLDRIAHLRKNAELIATALQGPQARIVPVWASRNLVRQGQAGYSAVYLSGSQVPLDSAAEPVLLGQQGDEFYFALELPEASFAADDVRFEDLRVAGGQLPAQEAGVLAYARAMLHWRSRHRFCGACGAPTASASAGHVMRCSNAGCGAEHFPRLDPAIIVLITDGERALLGRQAAWPPGRYSTIAGFVEPGESLEDAVVREAYEETGVAIVEADYHSSQPWPFPSSLMIGFIARAAAGATARADEELEDVRWFSRDDIASGFPGLPPPQSVSYRLIEEWYDSAATLPLAATPGVKLWGSRSR